MATTEIRKLTALRKSVEASVQNATRDLSLLDIIEKVLSSIEQDTESLMVANMAISQVISFLSGRAISDDVSDLIERFEATQEQVEEAYKYISATHLSAANDPQLDEDDGVVDAFARLLSEIAEMQNNLNTLCWILREEEAEQESPRPGEYNDADELFAAMGV